MSSGGASTGNKTLNPANKRTFPGRNNLTVRNSLNTHAREKRELYTAQVGGRNKSYNNTMRVAHQQDWGASSSIAGK